MSTVIKNPTPKQRFQLEKNAVSTHRDMIGSALFDHSADLAMLDLVRSVVVSADGNPNAALAGFYRIQGAHEFLHSLRNLGETPTPIQRLEGAELDQTV